MRIWKCDTNWGGVPVLDLFNDFRIAFFGTDVARIGHYEEARPGDLIGIAQGTKIVAVAEVLSPFAPLEEIGKEILPHDIMRGYAKESGVAPQACRISSSMWLSRPIINGRRGGRFYELPPGSDGYQSVLNAWTRHQETPSEQKFDIQAGKKTLIGANPDRSLLSGDKVRYVIPVYQRAYAWEEEQITRLLEDISEGVQTGDPRFFGSIQVSAPRKLADQIFSYELIDGQQRLSTLLILLRHLGSDYDYTDKLRTVVNAGSAQKDWDEFRETFGKKSTNKSPLNKYIQASQIIGNWLRERAAEPGGKSTQELLQFIQEKLLFVVIQTTAGISKTIQIFNVINTAGMDLNASDLFKIRFYEYLTKGTGPNEHMFGRVSKCYQKIEDYNRDHGDEVISMEDTIAFYQKVIVSKFDLNSELFSMATQRFFEQMFDRLLDGKKWPGFTDKIVLTIEGFERAVDITIELHRRTMRNAHLRIMQYFLWETRYGYISSQYPALACYFKILDVTDEKSVAVFAEKLFKKLVPPSLYFDRVVNDVRHTKLRDVLTAFSTGKDAVYETLNTTWTIKGVEERDMLEKGLARGIADRRSWKNLVCKLVEYLQSSGRPEENVAQLLFGTEFDVEHIQSATDETDRDGVWGEWDWELNGLGNLAMLESSLNRSIQNKTARKEEAYRRSKFSSIAEVLKSMANGKWKLEQARARRERLSKMISNYVLCENKADSITQIH